MTTQRKYFGTDGIRGRVGRNDDHSGNAITPDFALKLGWAVGRVLAKSQMHGNEHAGVLIGKDTRLSGYLIEAALESGLSASGVDVYLTGPLPTPGVAYLTRALRRSAGIVISASHNPFHDNGIKFFSSLGAKLPDEIEIAIERELDKPLECVAPDAFGKAFRVDDAAGRYIEFCKSAFPNDLDLKGFRIIVDCAHGATYHVAPPVFHELGADVIAVAAKPNGVNINDGVGAVNPQYLVQKMHQHHAQLGLALDGDGDRLIMVDTHGRIYDGDALLYIIACDYLRHGALKNEGVVGTQMSNLGFEQALQRQGISLERAAVGDRYVLARLLERGWKLGGENSGHLLALNHHTTGDGIIAALLVFRALIEQNLDLESATRDLILFPQKLINVPLIGNWQYRQSHVVRAAEMELTAALGKRGRILLRASGTEPLLRIMVEAEDELLATNIAQQLANVVQDAMKNEA
ncbi:MAG: phosphoglucosamine mutase [Burkholderiales bacterium]|jgi:phosphoglucosamine mutase|nr:phosphoglucosamine mutase [Burkholderiales bacterium]